MVGQESLYAYYKTNFNMMIHHGMNPEYFDNITPWEKRIYMAELDNYIKEKNAEITRQQGASGMTKVQHPGDY